MHVDSCLMNQTKRKRRHVPPRSQLDSRAEGTMVQIGWNVSCDGLTFSFPHGRADFEVFPSTEMWKGRDKVPSTWQSCPNWLFRLSEFHTYLFLCYLRFQKANGTQSTPSGEHSKVPRSTPFRRPLKWLWILLSTSHGALLGWTACNTSFHLTAVRWRSCYHFSEEGRLREVKLTHPRHVAKSWHSLKGRFWVQVVLSPQPKYID